MVALNKMDPRAVARNYIRQLISEPPGLKALLLDDETIRIISLLYTQSELLMNEVVYIEKLSKITSSESLRHLTAIIFIRPTAENVHELRKQLRHSYFPSYRLFFTNILKRTYVEEIAYADAHDAVSHLRELFVDYYVLSSHLLSFNVTPCLPIMTAKRIASSSAASSSSTIMHNPHVERTVDAITSLALSLKLSSPQVRYEQSSSLCQNVAQRLCVRFDQERSLFDFPSKLKHSSKEPVNPSPLILIVDRREDPVTPLLNQWTYEAMIHELIGIKNNRVSLHDSKTNKNIPEHLKELVLDDINDEFFIKNRYVNFGDLGMNLQQLIDKFQNENETSKRNVKSIEQMIKFVTDYPNLRQQSTNLSKHVTITGELSNLVSSMNLLKISELEQDIACRESESDHRKQIFDILNSFKDNNKMLLSDKLRLVILYSLRYEQFLNNNSNYLMQMIKILKSLGINNNGIQLIHSIKQYAGNAKRSSDLFNNRTFFAVASSTVRRGIIRGIENVYTQHEPLLSYTLDNLFRNKLKSAAFPLVRQDENDVNSLLGSPSISSTSSSIQNSNLATILPSRQVIVVMAGGTTYEEAKCVSGINGDPNAFVPPEGSVTASAAQAAKQIQARVILTGTTVHNSTSFAVEITRNISAQQQEHFVRPSR